MFKQLLVSTLYLLCTFCSYALEPTIVVVGPPGSGKGTFSQHLKENYGYNHISAGDVIRKEIEQKSSIGLEIANMVRRGENIPSPILHQLIKQKIISCSVDKKPFIIDGFGRTREDMDFLIEMLTHLHLSQSSFVLFLDASDATCIERISNRIVCNRCGHVFNQVTTPPQIEGCCTICQSPLSFRMNDTRTSIEKRLLSYRTTIENNYRRGMSLLPSIYFSTEKSLSDCLEFYSDLAHKVQEEHISTLEIVKSFS